MKVLKRLLSRITLYPTVFLAGFICLLLATIFSELSPFLLQKMIDGPLTALTHGGGQGDLLQMGGFYLLVLSLGQLISYMGNRILLHGSNQVTASLRDKAFQVMQGLPISYFDDKPAGKIATRIVNDTAVSYTHLSSILSWPHPTSVIIWIDACHRYRPIETQKAEVYSECHSL